MLLLEHLWKILPVQCCVLLCCTFSFCSVLPFTVLSVQGTATDDGRYVFGYLQLNEPRGFIKQGEINATWNERADVYITHGPVVVIDDCAYAKQLNGQWLTISSAPNRPQLNVAFPLVNGTVHLERGQLRVIGNDDTILLGMGL